MTETSYLALIVAALSFFLSASAGFGGSLILVPALALLLGAKEGITLATILLAANNVAKVIAYRRTIPWRTSATTVALLAVGAAIGARLLVTADVRWAQFAVLASFCATFLLERMNLTFLERLGAPLLAFGGGLSSGFSGTSGPLKGLALRALQLDRFHFLGAASLVSLVGDATKATVFAAGVLIDSSMSTLLFAALPLMIVGTSLGYLFNVRISERAFALLFWAVIIGYATRLIIRFIAPA